MRPAPRSRAFSFVEEQYMSSSLAAARRARAAASPAVLRGAYRLLFVGSAAWALVVALLWVASYSGALVLPTAMDPLAWHQHEMLYGFLGAAIAGFLSAAVPNWTGRPAFAGVPVALVAGWWLAARLAVLFSASVPPIIGAVTDTGFYLFVAAAALAEVLAAKNRNVAIPVIVGLFAISNGLHHAEAMGAQVPLGLGMRGGFSIVLVLICIIGGRIIPTFTRNWLEREERGGRMPAAAGRFDLAAIGGAAVALFAWTGWPFSAGAGALLICAGAAHAFRLLRWSGFKVLSDPIVFILHVAYAWIPIGLALLGCSILLPSVPGTTAVHALAAGAMGTITLAVMTRASLGHTGRPIRADAWTVAMYVLITIGALLRVLSPLLPLDYLTGLRVAGIAWGSAFLLFLFAYGPKLFRPRLDGGL
jgi:uncharacterized protein involved in response to NO